jgi:hypothetical protein
MVVADYSAEKDGFFGAPVRLIPINRSEIEAFRGIDLAVHQLTNVPLTEAMYGGGKVGRDSSRFAPRQTLISP